MGVVRRLHISPQNNIRSLEIIAFPITLCKQQVMLLLPFSLVLPSDGQTHADIARASVVGSADEAVSCELPMADRQDIRIGPCTAFRTSAWRQRIVLWMIKMNLQRYCGDSCANIYFCLLHGNWCGVKTRLPLAIVVRFKPVCLG